MSLSRLGLASRRAFHAASPRAARILCLDNIDPVSSVAHQLLRAPSSAGRHNSMRVDEGRNGWNLPAIRNKARTIVGTGDRSLLSDPGSELPLGEKKEKGKVRGEYKGWTKNRYKLPTTRYLL